MRIRFYIDPVTGEPHIYSHGEDVLTNPGEDRPGREGSRLLLAKPGKDGTCGLSTYRIRNRTA